MRTTAQPKKTAKSVTQTNLPLAPLDSFFGIAEISEGSASELPRRTNRGVHQGTRYGFRWFREPR